MYKRTYITIMQRLWIEWIKVSGYNFFEAWGSFWLWISDSYSQWIQQNPLEFENVTCAFMNSQGKSPEITNYKVQCHSLVFMYTTKFLHESKIPDIETIKVKYPCEVTEDTKEKLDEISDAMTLFKGVSNECYQNFVNVFIQLTNKDIFH